MYAICLCMYVHTRTTTYTYIDFICIFQKLLMVHSIILVPSVPPQNVTTNVISSTAIMIIWNPPTVIYQNGFINYYQLIITNLNGFNSTATTPHTNYTAMDLQINTLYNFEVAAATAIGLGPFSDPVSNQTFEGG